MSVGDKYECEGQMSLFDLDSWCGKTCQEHSAQMAEKISEPSSRKLRGLQTQAPLFLNLKSVGGGWKPAGCIMGDGWSIAWRVHDAQFWGVPQRRKRIALVADFGGSAAPEILFERKGLLGDSAESSTEKKDFAGGARPSAEVSSRAISFQERAGKPGGGKGILIQDEHTGALSTFNNQAVCYDARGNGDGQTVPTITGDHNNRVTDYSALLFEPCNWDGEQVAPTLTQNNAGGGQRMPDKENFNAVLDVAYGLDRASFNQGVNTQYNFSVDEELIGSMTAKGPGAVCNSVVRRLTPTEEERLQGFPDGWTDIGEWVDSNGKRHKEADTPRYKALGNSIALPFWEWMAVRMLGCLGAYRPTMASLFDGIGGFPLAFSRAGCKPVWASEIEEFPIAVTKIRFPEED